MTVYADILVLVNFVVDYFLIAIACRFLHKKPRVLRLILSAATGGIFSLYILFPQGSFVSQLTVQILMSMVLVLIAIGFGGVKSFLRSTIVLFCVNFAYSGAMIAVWLIFSPRGMVINNSIVYFDISPLFLILFSVVGYFFVVLLRRIFKKTFPDQIYCSATLFCNQKTLTLGGIADTGNSVTDVFGYSEILITERATVEELLGDEMQNPARYRKIPCATIAGETLLEGYRIDCAEVEFNGKKHMFQRPILAISSSPLVDCKIIVNPESLA